MNYILRKLFKRIEGRVGVDLGVVGSRVLLSLGFFICGLVFDVGRVIVMFLLLGKVSLW